MAKQVMVSSKVRKFTNLAEMEKEDKGSVFVLNVATGELNGQILINVPKKHGNGSDLVKIPRTFIPMDLTNQVTRSQLMESSEFRKTVTGGLLKLVTPEYAEMLLSSEDGREEKRRIENEMSKAKTIIANAGVTSEDSEEEEYADREDAEEDAKKRREVKSSKTADGGVSVKLQTLVNSAAEDDLDERGIVAKLRNYNGGEFKNKELDFLSKRYANKPRIMKYLKEVYAAKKKAKARAEA